MHRAKIQNSPSPAQIYHTEKNPCIVRRTSNMESLVPKDMPEAKAAGTYVVPTLGLSDGTFVFTYLGAFLSYITPQDLPVGMCFFFIVFIAQFSSVFKLILPFLVQVNCVLELLRNGFHAKMSVVQLIMEVRTDVN